MKIKIEQVPSKPTSGRLIINGDYKYCPFSKDDRICGTWCALFDEPTEWEAAPGGELSIHVRLCRSGWSCIKSDFTDERIKDA